MGRHRRSSAVLFNPKDIKYLTQEVYKTNTFENFSEEIHLFKEPRKKISNTSSYDIAIPPALTTAGNSIEFSDDATKSQTEFTNKRPSWISMVLSKSRTYSSDTSIEDSEEYMGR